MSLVKFLLNTAIVGAVAGGVYYYLDQNAKANAASAEDPDLAPTALDPENIKDAADRAYTSIQHGTEQVTESIRKAVGPQGEQVINDVTDAATKVRDSVAEYIKSEIPVSVEISKEAEAFVAEPADFDEGDAEEPEDKDLDEGDIEEPEDKDFDEGDAEEKVEAPVEAAPADAAQIEEFFDEDSAN